MALESCDHALIIYTHFIQSYGKESRNSSQPFFVRERPFNLKGGGGGYGFLFRSEFFFGQHKSKNIYFFGRAKRNFFFPEFNIRLYDKNSESDYYFFPPPKSEYFFQQHWAIKKTMCVCPNPTDS